MIGRDVVIIAGCNGVPLVAWQARNSSVNDQQGSSIPKKHRFLRYAQRCCTLLYTVMMRGFNAMGLQWGVAATTLLSGITYMILWGRYAFAKG